MQDRQCPSCGGICKRHCEKADVPQRLSDEEIIDIAENLKETNQPYNINFARAIEERHGIK